MQRRMAVEGMRRVAFFVAAALLVAGCGTPYQEKGARGGVEAQQITADTYRIKANTNVYTDDTETRDYVLLKAAETTKAAGGTHFVLIGIEDANQRTSGDAFRGRNVSFGTADQMIKPGHDTIIRIYKKAPKDIGNFTADEVIQSVGSRVKRG